MKRIFLALLMILVQLSATAKNKTWICINENGETVFTIEAIHVSEFHNGRAVVYKNTLVNNQWITGSGYIDKTGKVIIPCDLKDAKDFKSTVTWVKRQGQDYYTLIDLNGNVIPTKHYKKVKNFTADQQDVCGVYEDGKLGFINRSGKEIIPCKYTGSSIFTEGLASVSLANSVKGEYGFINKKGEVVIPLKFIQAGTSSFKNGLARATVGGKTVLIDKKGNPVFKTNKGNIQGQSFGLVSVITKPNRKGWGWVNFKDEFVIDPVYDYATNFNEDGYAIVEKNGLKGVIDTTGKIILPLKYETVYCDISTDGYLLGVYPSTEATSLANARKDYFDANLKRIPTENIKYIMGDRKTGRLAFSTKDGKKGYLNRRFEIVIPARYSKTTFFSEGLAWVRM